MTDEHLQAVAAYIRQVKLAQRVAPEEPIITIFNCGCMGPTPKCKCAKRSRLVAEFLEEVK